MKLYELKVGAKFTYKGCEWRITAKHDRMATCAEYRTGMPTGTVKKFYLVLEVE